MKYATLAMLAVLLSSALAAQSTGPSPTPTPAPSGTYTVSSGAVPAYADLVGGTDLFLAYGSNVLISPAGFSFNYFGVNYTSVRVYASGYVVMGSAFGTPTKAVNHSSGVGNFVSPLWGDYNPAAWLGFSATLGQVNWLYQSNQLIIEWKNIPSNGNNAVGVRMQVQFDTTSGRIDMRYGAPNGGSGYVNNSANACAISSPAAGTQEVVPGADAGYISTSGAVTAYPAGRYVRFSPNVATPNTPPALTVKSGGVLVTGGATLNVNHGDTVASLTPEITVSDADADSISVTTTITNIAATGILPAEWSKAAAPGPFNLNPASGTFNTLAGATHLITVTANDGSADTIVSFSIVQAAAGPVLSVSDAGGAISNGASAAGTLRDFGSQDVSSGATAAVVFTISNSGGTDLVLSNFAITGADFVLDTTGTSLTVTAAGSTTFSVAFDPASAGVKTADVSFSHNGGSFSFEVAGVGTIPLTPQLVVRAGGVAGTPVSSGYTHDFGTLALTSLPTADYVFYLHNAGTADLTITNLTVTGHVSAGMTMPITLTPGSGTNLGVSFDAVASGVFIGTVTFAHDDTTVASPFTLNFTGTVAGSGGGPVAGGVAAGSGGGGGGCAAASSGLSGLLMLAMLAVMGLKRRREA